MTQRELNYVPDIGDEYEELETGLIWIVIENAAGVLDIHCDGEIRTLSACEVNANYYLLDNKGKS